MSRLRTAAATALVAVVTLLLMATPAGAQQPVDATTDGGLAFVLFAFMVFIFAGIIFSMDRIRRRRGEQ